MAPRPATASVTPATCRRLGRSPSATAASGMVNTGCSGAITDASPAGSPVFIATNSRPNCPTQMNRPTPTTAGQRTSGGGTKKTAGKAISPKRSAAKRSGGNDSSPMSMTTKFTAQQIATTSARTAFRRGISVTRSRRASYGVGHRVAGRGLRLGRGERLVVDAIAGDESAGADQAGDEGAAPPDGVG